MARKSQTKSDERIEPVEEPMDFDVWFTLLKAANPRFQEWQRPELKAFMRSKGLSVQETRAKYDVTFEKY